MQVFVSVKVPKATKEAKKITRIANRISSRARDARKSGPVTVIVLKA